MLVENSISKLLQISHSYLFKKKLLSSSKETIFEWSYYQRSFQVSSIWYKTTFTPILVITVTILSFTEFTKLNSAIGG